MIIREEKPIVNDLMVALINKNVIRRGTELLIPRVGTDLSGSRSVPFDHIVKVLETKIVNGTGYCLAQSTTDDARFKVKAKEIFLIDGMDPDRIANSFGLKLDGSSKSAGKKRGRKPKNRK